VLEIVGLLLFGLLVGCYGTLVGIGGGPILVPMLATLYRFDTPTIVAVSVLVVFCNTASGTIAYLKERRIDLVSGIKFSLAAIPGALLSVVALHYIKINVFSFLFGFFLVLLALYIFLRPYGARFAGSRGMFPKRFRPGNKKSGHSRLSLDDDFLDAMEEPETTLVQRVIIDRSGNRYAYAVNEKLGIILTAIIGAVSTLLGIGGGLIQVPVLVYVLAFPVHVATATSHFITAVNAGFTLIPLLVDGDLDYKTAICLSIGAVVGAQFGARLSNFIGDKALLLLLVPVFIFMGVKLMFFNF